VLALLSNAVEAMPYGGRVSVAAALADPKLMQFTVTDTGSGIAPEHLKRIFNLFFTTKSSGTGFGLAVVKKIVESHGGSIRVQSTPGEGTQFTVELPVA